MIKMTRSQMGQFEGNRNIKNGEGSAVAEFLDCCCGCDSDACKEPENDAGDNIHEIGI